MSELRADARRSFAGSVRDLEARGQGIKPGLDRMKEVVEPMDNPQLKYPTVHLAGTNGKSSTAWMIGEILGAHGLATGVYTSPHLQTVRERFRLSGPEGSQLISESEFSRIYEYLLPIVQLVENRRDEEVSYFEMTTLTAFEWMYDKPVGAGVFEAGLGGEWDATNLVEASVAVLTEIDVDHQAFLGTTPAENAREKAGIIKGGAAVVCAPQHAEVDEIIKKAARQQDAPLMTLGKDFSIVSDEKAVGGRLATIQGLLSKYPDVFLALHGSHQVRNLALAVAASESFLNRPLDESALSQAAARVSSPGRLEVARRSPLVLLDGAHNPAAARELATAMLETFPDARVTAVLSIFEDKDVAGILEFIVPLADRIILAKSLSPRSASPAKMAEAGALAAGFETAASVPEAVDRAIADCDHGDIVLVTGSLFAVGEARDHLSLPPPN